MSQGHASMPLAAYGALGLPLAMAALPVYVQAPAYYAGTLGLPLATTGMVLFAARLVDTVQDPWLGRWIDRLAGAGRLHGVLWAAAAGLALGFAGLWLPPAQGWLLAAWLAGMLVLVYTCHSLLQITHLAWGARLGFVPTVTRAAAWREGLGLAGVLGASVVPAWVLQPGAAEPQRGLALYALGFAALLVAGLVLLLRAAPAWAGQRDDQAPAWREAWATPGFRALLLPYFLNALSVALPATLALFFIQDRIGAGAQAGWLLGLYFLAGAAGLPLWSRLAQRMGAARAWRCGMVLSVLAFSATVLLGPGDLLPYALVCAGAGLALGADLALPPVLLAARIPPGVQAAGYFGVWTLLGKLALAVSGLALPLLAVLGYTPGMAATSQGGWALALLYAGLPCVFKLAALVALSRGVITAPEENP